MLETCTVMGDFASVLVKEGRMRQASRKDVLETKAAAEKEGLVTWMMADDGTKLFRSSCSCCGDCCGALRQVTQFNSPGFVAPPHFMPGIDLDACTYCGKCAKVCPMGAMEVSGEGAKKVHTHKPERCIGCGLCAVACDKVALALREVPGYREPPRSFLSYVLKDGRNYAINSFKVWRERRRI
jgi:Pyruvate/2-oxoacid:ferredoxin oxidoreductase delta subunit